MKAPKFLSLLQTLSTESFHRFRRYLEYSTPRSYLYPPVMDFLAGIHPNYKDYKGDLRSDIENILLAHEAKSMDNKRRGNFLSRLNIQLEDFLAIEQLKKEKATRRLLILQALRHQATATLYNEELEDSILKLVDQADLSTDYHYTLMRVYHEAYYNTINNKLLMKDQGEEYLKRAQEQLQLLFQKLDLKYKLEMKNRSNVVRVSEDSSHNLFASAQKKTGPNDIFFRMYQMVNEIQEDPLDEQLFQNLYQFYLQQRHQLDVEDQSILLRYIKNASAKLLRNGSSSNHLRLSFELANLGWRHNIFDALGGFTPMNFLNYVEIATALNELDWLEEFIPSAIRKIPTGQQVEVKSLALATLYFGQKNYSEALTLLRVTKSKEEQLELRIRMLYCKIFYETKETAALISIIKSFDTYLRRSFTFQKEIIQGYHNFLKLLRLIAEPHKAKFEKLAKLLPTVNPLYGRIWLEQQLLTKN